MSDSLATERRDQVRALEKLEIGELWFDIIHPPVRASVCG